MSLIFYSAPASNTSKLTDGLGRVSEGYSGGGNIGIGAVGILAVIAEEDEGEASANKKENDDAETASSKNNSRKVERKHHSKSRLRRGAEEGKKKSSGSSSKKSKSRSTKSKRTHGHSSASSEDGEIKKYGSNCDDESNDEDYNKRSRKEIKRRRKRENKKASSRSNSTSNRCDATATLDHADSPNSKQKDTERKKTLKQTRSQSITPTTARSHDNYRHHRHRHQVINSRTQANHEEAQLDDENVNKDASFAANVELNKRYHKQQGMLMSQSKSITNRIPSLFSISTSTSTVSSVVAMRRNKTSATSFLVSEKFTADARRGGGLGIRRPSSEKLLGRRVGSNNSNMKNTKCAVEKDCRSQNHSNRNISAICMKDRYESKITRAGTTARRWGNGTSTFTAFKAGYKVRESLAVVRNRNNDGNITAQQGQGGVGAARRYLFSSQRPRNNFKLSSVCSSAIVTEKVRRIQVNGNYGRNSFCGGINEDKVFGATRKSVSSGSGNSHTNVGGGSGITTRHNAPS